MRLWSTKESAGAGEPSLLAIAETLAAMGVSVWIGVHFGTWMHVAVGACIAPFLLLRTEESCLYVVEHTFLVAHSIRKAESVFAFVFVPTFPVLVAAIRVWVTLVHVVPHPIIALRAFPANWWRTVLATDTATSPQWIPTPADTNNLGLFRDDGYLYSTVRGILVDDPPWKQRKRAPDKTSTLSLVAFILFGVGPFLMAAAVFAFAYRWSIKSTALIWAPMLWALKPAKPADRDWKTHLRIEADLKKPQFVAVVSVVCLAAIAVKYALWAGQFELAMKAEAWREVLRGWGLRVADSPLADAIVAVVRPGAIPLWQVAVFFNSLLGLLVWWKIRHWLAHFKHGVPPTDRSITRTLAVTFFFRHLLTSYVIICDGFVAIQLARNLPVPEIGWKLFPWL